MACPKNFLISDKNIHLFARVHGQTTWTRADRVPLATTATTAFSRPVVSAATMDDDFTRVTAGNLSAVVTIEYLYGVESATDVLFEAAQLLGEPLEFLEVVGDYPDINAVRNEYSTGCYRITNLERVTSTNAAVSRSITLVATAKPTFGTDLNTVDPGTIPDIIPPTVTLAASSTNVTSATTITLTATATDNIGVHKVEFWDGATLLGTDFSTAFDWGVPLTSADNGTKSYTAKAYDLAGNVTTSNPVTVTVSIVASAYPAGMIYGLDMINVVGSQLIPLPEAENQTPTNILGGAADAQGMGGLRATWNFGDPNLLAANGSDGVTYYVVSELNRTLGAWWEQYPIITDILGANYNWTQSAVHLRRDYHSSGSHNLLGWDLGRGGDAPASNPPSAIIVSPKPEPSASGIGWLAARVGPTFGGAPSAAGLGLKAVSAYGTYNQPTPTSTNPFLATLNPPRSVLGIGTTADNLDATNGGPSDIFAGNQKFYYLLIFRGEHDLATETAVIAQIRAELAVRGVTLP